MGSLRGYHVHQLHNRDFPTVNIFTQKSHAPVKLVGMSSYVVNGAVHAHARLGTGDNAISET